MWESFLVITCQLRFSVIPCFISLSLCDENSSCSSKILFLSDVCAWYQLLGLETHFLAVPATTCGHVTNFLPRKIREEMICAVMDVALSESVYSLFPHPLMNIDIKAPGKQDLTWRNLGPRFFMSKKAAAIWTILHLMSNRILLYLSHCILGSICFNSLAFHN